MIKATHVRRSDLRGLRELATHSTLALTDLVEAMHAAVIETPGMPGRTSRGRTTGITGFVYKSVRGVTRVVGVGIDALLGMLGPMLADRPSSEEREAVLAALNGVFGDYLAASANSLAIPMAVRAEGAPVLVARAALTAAFPGPGRKVAVLLHGLCMNDLQWSREGHDHGAALARDLGYAPVYIHYNTGRHIPTNGREFADLMETLLREWPHPVERLAIIGHSMGGLVARSACHHAACENHEWLKRLDDLVFLGTPHFGAPLERAGAWVDLLMGLSPYTAPFARLGKVRSAGIKDLRHGCVRDDAEPAALPRGVRCHAIAASKQRRPNASATAIRGDGLVPVASALGRHRNPSLELSIPKAHRRVVYGTGHLDLLCSAEVYGLVRAFLAVPRDSQRNARGRGRGT